MSNETPIWPKGLSVETFVDGNGLLGLRLNTNVERVIENVGNVQKLTIHYKNGAEFNVSNALDVQVIRRKGGGFDVRYAVQVDETEVFDGIRETDYGQRRFETLTGDVVALTTRMPKAGYTRATEYLEFGGK